MDAIQMMMFGVVLGILCVGVAIGIAISKAAVRSMRNTLRREQHNSVHLGTKLFVATEVGRYLARRAYDAESRHSKTGDFETWMTDAQAAYEETEAFRQARDEYYAENGLS